MILVYRTDAGVDFASVLNKPAVYSHETSTDSIQQPRQALNTQRRLPVYDTQFADQATRAQQTQNSNTHTGPHTHTHTVGSARDGPLRAPLSRRVAESAKKAHSSSVRENQGGTLHTNSISRHHGQASRRVHPSLSLSVPHTSVIMLRTCCTTRVPLCPIVTLSPPLFSGTCLSLPSRSILQGIAPQSAITSTPLPAYTARDQSHELSARRCSHRHESLTHPRRRDTTDLSSLISCQFQATH